MAQDAQDVPRKIAALEQQVQQLLQAQKPQIAIPVLSELVSLDPKNLNGHANLGVLLFFQGNYAGAAPHLRTALEMKPDLWRIEALLESRRSAEEIRERHSTTWSVHSPTWTTRRFRLRRVWN
jgi:tetratricopeptide (TPR) repeat protein